jgi:hypothetical protein
MRRSTTLIYDDSWITPDEIGSLVGFTPFGSLLHDRRRLRDTVRLAVTAAGFTSREVIGDAAERRTLAERVAGAAGDTRYVYLSADVVGSAPGTLERFLEKVAFADHEMVATPSPAWPGTCIAALDTRWLRRLLGCDTPKSRRDFFPDVKDSFEAIPAESLLCLSEADVFVRFLSGSFYTRAFNTISERGRTIVKRSNSVAKMRSEHDFWYLLPPELQRFFVQPFQLTASATSASYRMERLNVPDLAVLWVHGPDAMPDEAFGDFLDAVFEWLGERPRRTDPAGARAIAEDLYVTKLHRRVEELLATEVGQRLDRLLQATVALDGLRGLVAKVGELLRKRGGVASGEEVALSHGDLCFSNILFDRRSRLLKFIDPRGATTEADLYSDPYYDVAKLSHSILGGYDFLNHGLFDIFVDELLRIELRTDRPPPGVREQGFRERLTRNGFDPVRTRLYEATLFLSMLPLHVEAPRKLLAFALTAANILDEVEARGRGTLFEQIKSALRGSGPA